MHKALREGQFTVYYQPKYNVSGDVPRLCSAEALVRWKHPDYGMVSPGVFIPLFESNGLIREIDWYVWNEAAKQVREWNETYGINFSISINLSRIDIFEPGIEDKLKLLIDSHNLSPDNLYLEITESAYTHDVDKLDDIVKGIEAMGFTIEMDDFGSGYSSLNMIAKLPIDVLKMDMKFVKSLHTENSRDYRLVEIVADIARFLNVPLVAEGVETEEQLRLCKKAGCSIIQGYYFAPPLPAKEFEKLLRKDLLG